MVRSLLALRVNFVLTIAAVWASQTGAATAKEESAKASIGSSGASAKGPKDEPQGRPLNSPLASVIGVGPAFFSEDTDLVDERRVNGQRSGQAEREARISDGILALQAWYLTPWWLKRLRVGPGLAWYNAYTLMPDDEDNNDERYHVGQTFMLFAQGEFVLIDVASKMDVLLGLRTGGIVVFPGSDLQNELDVHESEGFDVWQTPRLGAMISPHIGFTWPLNNRLSARADIGMQFAKIWLYNAEAEAAGSLIELKKEILTTRTQVLLGLEFGL